jgi:Clp amino terminal domain, pathogenicity island component
MRLGADRLGTEHLLLGLAREGDGVAARVLQELGAGLLELQEAVAERYAAGVDPEPFPPDRGPPPWEPPPSATLRRVVPLEQEHPLPSGDRLVLLSLEVWSDWFDLRYAVVYATPERRGSCHGRRSSATARRPTGPAPPTPTEPALTLALAWCASISAPSCPHRRPAPSCWSCGSASPPPGPGRRHR